MREGRKGHSVLGPPQENHCACWSGLAAERQTMAASVPGKGSSNLGPSLVPGLFYSFLHSNREYHTVRPEAELGLRKFQACLSLPYPSHQDIWSSFLPSLPVPGAAVHLPDSCCGSVMAGASGSQAGFSCKAYSFGSTGSFASQP